MKNQFNFLRYLSCFRGVIDICDLFAFLKFKVSSVSSYKTYNKKISYALITLRIEFSNINYIHFIEKYKILDLQNLLLFKILIRFSILTKFSNHLEAQSKQFIKDICNEITILSKKKFQLCQKSFTGLMVWLKV